LAGTRRSLAIAAAALGLVVVALVVRFGSAATFTVPSSALIAHAQAVGPWTSTPFASAIPPSLSFSSIGAKGSRAGRGRD